MGRPPMPIGTWGLIRTYPVAQDENGKPTRFRAMASFRDFDGVTRSLQARGKTATQASQNLRMRLQNRARGGAGGELNGMTRFSTAAKTWVAKIEDQVADGQRSPGTLDTYGRQLKNHVLPALGEVRLAEITPPMAHRVVRTFKQEISPASARSCRSVISGVLGLAVLHGAIPANPMREIGRIESKPRKEPRALTPEERVELLRQLRTDEKAVYRDLPDLVFFMLATGCRIGEALAVLWSEVDFEAGTVEITSTLIRVKSEGLLRKSTKSRAGERVLALPMSAQAILRRRFMTGARLDQPLFPSVVGDFRDPANVRRELRDARGDGLGWITSHTFRKTAATILDEAALSARLVADQLGHSRTSMTQDFYLGRRSVDDQAAVALEAALRGTLEDE